MTKLFMIEILLRPVRYKRIMNMPYTTIKISSITKSGVDL